MSSELINEDALQEACTEFKAGRRSSRWTHQSLDGYLRVGVSPDRVVVNIVDATKAEADAWEAACKAVAKMDTYVHTPRLEGEHRFAFEPK